MIFILSRQGYSGEVGRLSLIFLKVHFKFEILLITAPNYKFTREDRTKMTIKQLLLSG